MSAPIEIEVANSQTVECALQLLGVQLEEHHIAIDRSVLERALRGLVEVEGRGRVLLARQDGSVVEGLYIREGFLLECLDNPAVERVCSVSRRPCGRTHPKLTELLVPDFRDLGTVETKLSGYDACFYCAGISSVGMSETAASPPTMRRSPSRRRCRVPIPR